MLLLAYASTAAFDFADGDLITLLMNSRANNRRLGITGLLLHDEGRFVQVLEGEAASVRDRYARIAADPRHVDVTMLLEENEPKRRFPKWTMGYKALNDRLVESIPGFNSFFSDQPADQSTPLKHLLEEFREGADLAESVEHD